MEHPCVTHGSLLYTVKQTNPGSLLNCYPERVDLQGG